MSDAVKPQLHGRDHRPGGRDPIPGITESTGGSPTFAWARQSQTGGSDTNVPANSNVQFTNFDTAESSDDTIFDLVSNGNEIKVLQSGLYSITAQTEWGTYSDSERVMWVVLVRTDQIIAQVESVVNADDWLILTGNFRLQAGDRLQLWMHQDSGGATQTIYGGHDGSDAGGTDEGNFLEARLIGDGLGGGTSWARRRVYNQTNQSIASGSEINVQMDDFQTSNSSIFTAYDSGSADGITVALDGLYMLSARMFWNQDPDEAEMTINGIDPDGFAGYTFHKSKLFNTEVVAGGMAVRLAAGQHLYMSTYHEAGSAKTIYGGNGAGGGTFFELVYLGGADLDDRRFD